MSSENNEHIEKLHHWIKSRKLTYIIFLIGIVSAIIIICFPVSKESDTNVSHQDETTAESYERYLIDQISLMVSAITNEPAPHVTVTLRTDGKTVYATEDRISERNSQEFSDSSLNKTLTDGDTEKTYIIVKSADGSQKPLVVMQIKPEIQGIVIVSRYGNDISVREKITQAVKTALNLSSTQVCVIGGIEYT